MTSARALNCFPIGVVTPKEAAAQRLRRQIELGWWPPGTELPPEMQMASSLGLSREAVRQGLRALADDGLIALGGARRLPARVLPLSPVDELAVRRQVKTDQDRYKQHLVVRRRVEAACAELAAVRRGENDLEAMEFAQGALRASLRAGSIARFRAADNEFHMAVALASKRPDLAEIVMTERIAMFRDLDPIFHERFSELQDTPGQHEGILIAIEQGDQGLAASKMEEHIGETGKLLIHEFDDPGL